MVKGGLLGGTPNGSTTTFTLPFALVPGSEQIHRQGLSQYIRPSGTPVLGEVTISGTTVTFPAAPHAPLTGDVLQWYGDTV